MEESEDNMSAEEIKFDDGPIKSKPKKRSLVERELETSLTARITSPLTTGDATSTSRYGRARRLKSDAELCDLERNVSRLHKSPKFDKSPSKMQSAAYKMHASNSPIKNETPKRDDTLENQIENIYNENVSLSRFGSEEKACMSATKKSPKVYIRKDLIQSKEKEDDTVVLIKNMFSPHSGKKSNNHLTNYMERSSEKYDVKKPINGYLNTSSVVKTLDFDSKKKKKEEKKMVLSKSELFNLEAQCEYQVGDLAWARMGTYPFWPCIITRDPLSGTFVKKKLYGRLERDVLHVTFFGDNGRRGWIVGTMLRKFLGQLEFEVARANFPSETKKKDPRLYAAFLISEKKMPQWQVSVEEAEILLREPKRLRIDILNEMLQKGTEIKTIPKHEKSKKIVRTNSDVSLSESLLDTLFSEDDTKGKDIERARSKSGNRSLDVSDVVTACLDNMAAKTGITKIQRQSHMDRWLQKAKSKTPEKSHLQSHLSLKMEKDNKVSNTAKLKKKLPKKSPPNKPHNYRKNITESQYETEKKLLSHQNEHDYSLRYRGSGPVILDAIEIEYENAEMFTSDVIEPGSGLGIISKVETLCGKDQAGNNDQTDVNMTNSSDKFTINRVNNIENTHIKSKVSLHSNHEKSVDLGSESFQVNGNYTLSLCTNESDIMEMKNKMKPIKLETSDTIVAINTKESKNYLETLSSDDTLKGTEIIKESDFYLSHQYVLDDASLDNESADIDILYTPTIQKKNSDIDQMYDSVEVQTVDRNISLIATKALTGEQIYPKGHIEVSDSKVAQNQLKNNDELPTLKSINKNITVRASPEKESDQKEIVFKNKEANIHNSKNTPRKVSLDVYDKCGNKDFLDVSTNILKKNNLEQATKTKLIQNKTFEFDNENQSTNLSIQGLESPYVISKRQVTTNCTENNTPTNVSLNVYADDAIVDFHDVSTNFFNNNILQQSSVMKDEFLQNKELQLNCRNKTKNLSIQSSDLSNVIIMKDYVDDGIVDFPDMTKTSKEKIITKNTTPNKETEITVSFLEYNELKSNNSNPKNEFTDISTKSRNVPNVVKLNNYVDEGMEDFPDVFTKNGEKNQLMESMGLRKTVINKPCHVNNRQNDLKEFETQLYNIFGISNKQSLKSRLNLSLNKSCSKNTKINEEFKTIDKGSLNNSNHESECKKSTVQNNKLYDSKITNVLVSILEVSPAENEVFFQKNHKNHSEKNFTDSSTAKNNKITRKAVSQLESDTIESHCKEDKVILTKNSIDINGGDTNHKDESKEPLAAFQSRLKPHASKPNTERKTLISKDSETAIKYNNDMIENIGINSYDSDKSLQKTELPNEHKLSNDARKALKNSDFLKYIELKQDALIDEQPELTEVEVTNYLYKTWLYEESLKTDVMKTDDIENAKLVNGLQKSPIKIRLSLNKSSRKNKKRYKVQITTDDENLTNSPDVFETKTNKIDFININKNINDVCINQSELTLKRSKRIIRNGHYSASFEKYCNSSIETDSYTDRQKGLELTAKDSGANCSSACPVEIKENISKESAISKEFSTVSGKLNQIEKHLHSYDEIDCVEKLSPNVSELVKQNGGHDGKLKSGKTLNVLNTDSNSSGEDEDPLVAHQLRLSLSKNQSAYVADGEINMKKSTDSKEETYKTEKDVTDLSVKSEDGEIAYKNKKLRTFDSSNDTKEDLINPDFLKYLELKQDTLIDENPELTEEDITNYLYKTWLYEESLKNDIKKADDIETVTNLVKGLNQETAPVKRVRKKKLEKDKQIDFNLASEDIPRKEKSKRKIIKQYFYKENFSDIEDDIEFFEIFQPKSKTTMPIKSLPIKDTFKIETADRSLNIQTFDPQVEFVPDAIDEVEEYFRQLTVPKPNLFKGLLREKLCEICEKGYNLIKCKGCYCMFHVDCVKKKTEIIEVTSSVRGRKKKKKPRGRKPKDHNSLDSDYQNDERSQDPNASDEMLNTSIENDIEPYVIANADDFEAQLAVKMKELLENPENNLENDAYSSAEELDWNDTDYGECKIVDVLPRKKNLGNDIDYSNFKCNDCQKYEIPVCFVCKTSVSPKNKAAHRQRCQVAHCQKYYHLECLDHWPQTQFNAGELSRKNNSNQLVEALTCPRHVCHTCVCDDPRGCKTRFSGDKLARCVRCPATYHTFTKCLPAGSQILTASHIICPRHYEHRPGTQPRHVNTGWCFICALGGTLICCEYCPTSFHAECLNIDPPEGGYMCEDCETGRLPLYGEMVWVKLGHYRWWPGIILHPSEIPLNIQAVKHSQGEFVVRFFGQYDYYWVNRGRVFPFQEGDSGRITTQKSKIDAAFTMAMEHAQRACEILKTASPNEVESMDIASSLLPPHYVKLKVNKPCGSLCGKKIDIEESSLTQCECDPNEVDPCGPYTQCLNRMLLTECGPTCRAGDRCNNRAFEKRLYPKMTPYRTSARGWGLKTLQDVKAGQFVIEYVGELIDEEEFKRRMRRKQEVRDENFYYLTLDKERMIDAGPKGNLARFMNHSCEPNCETQKWTVLGDVRVGLFAINDIPANSELTFNYNLESTGIEKKPCMCGAKRCSGYIGEKPKQEDQPKKNKPAIPTKRSYKKRKNIELSPSTKPKQKVGRPYKPRELTEIEKDLLIIKNATNSISSESESSSLLSIDSKDSKGLKRRRTDDIFSPSTKKYKFEKPIESDINLESNN
ncbi:jg6296 [Pararge aegeria aegeria]|uniref:Jg6296 protein n=4 Tax=Pararge aegeria TaxID=116150 RepID=A0A8S4RJS0_9NEOP|nr:jg6296 [Pararge aegeria aegeria]